MNIRASAAACVLLAGCASTGNSAITERDDLAVAVAPDGAGVYYLIGEQQLTLRLIEVDGSAAALPWPSGLDGDGFWHLRYCLDRSRVFRPSGRAIPPTWSDPALVHAEAFRCIAESGLPRPVEQALPPPTTFDVWLGVDSPRTNPAAGGGNPVWSSGGRGLGVLLLVSKGGLDMSQPLLEDARKCRDVAASGGVLETFESAPPGGFASGSSYLQYSFASIEPLVQRFQACLSGFGYEIRQPPRSNNPFAPQG